MSRTIEEIQGYFDVRPELWAKINKNLVDNFRKEENQSIVEWGKDIQEECDIQEDIAAEKIQNCIVYAFRHIMQESEQEESFKKWVNQEWHEGHVIGYKGFNSDMTCMGFQYEIGKEYAHDGAVFMCSSGFHACRNPLGVLRFYSGMNNRYCIVTQWGYMDERDVKRASSNIKIVKEITIRELFEAAEKRLKPIDGSNMRVVGEGQICRYVSLSTSLAIDGVRSNIILHRCFQNTQLRENKTIMGDENIIGIMDDMFTINVLGDGNLIYVFGNGIIINVTGDMNRVEIIGGKDCNVIVTGNYNRVQTRSKVNVTCIGYNNDVDAGVDSRVNLIDGEDIMSSVVKEKDIKLELI